MSPTIARPRFPALARLLTASLFLTPFACAFGDEVVRPPEAIDVVTRANRGAGRTVVVADSFADQRPDRSRCGMKKNGYNSDTAKLLCKGPPEDFLPRLLTSELRAAGFRVLPGSGSKLPQADAVISGSVQQYFVEPKLYVFGAVLEADVGLTLSVRLADGRVAERRFYVKGEEPTILASAEDAHTAASAATRELLASAAGAIANLLDQPAVTP